MFNDGATKNLLQLDGTIPVQYKGKQYGGRKLAVCVKEPEAAMDNFTN